MNKLMLGACAAALVGHTVPVVFANTNSLGKLYVCATPQENDLAQADYEALTWVEVKGVGSHGETGDSTNILTYDTWDNTVVQKGKGMTDAGSPDLELARKPYDPGQIILRAASETNFNYAFKMVKNDAVSINGTGTILYNRGIVTGPKRPHGRNEDFDLEIFGLGLNQKEICVDPSAGGNAPKLTVAPAITTDGTPAAGEVVTVSNGTFTGDATITYAYQWFAGGVAIAGANANTFTITAAQSGKVLTARVTATNASGSASGYAAPTPAVA